MGEPSETRVVAVRRLIAQVPDGAIRNLETALANANRADLSVALVQDIVSAEVTERRVRAALLAPLLPLCAPARDTLQRLTFPAAAPNLVWRALKAADEETVALAVRTAGTLRPDDETPEVFDGLCRRAAEGLIAGEPAFQPLAKALEDHRSGASEQFAELLSLIRLAREALARLPAWVRTLNQEYAAAIRLAFRDAVAVREDAGPLFMEILFGHLQDPHQILRLISLVMDRPSDRYLASSELASFGQRLLGDIERRIEEVRRFDANRGLEGGVALAESIHVTTAIINEFEQWLALSREGPWGSRLGTSKRALALTVEARLREVEPAVGAALPTQPARTRAIPRITGDPDAAAVQRAHALVAFVYETRSSASYGGFGAVRAKVLEALDPRLDHYAADLLDQLHNEPEAPVERLRAYLEITAEYLGLVRDPKAADIVRRRAAVA